MRGDTSKIQARLDLVDSMKKVFKKYSRANSKSAWKAISSPNGSKEIEKLINNTNRSLSVFKTLNFREWLGN